MLDRDYGADPMQDWLRERSLTVGESGLADQEWEGVYYDAGHPSSRDLKVVQRSYAWAAAPDDEY